jgi:hypothetical protein
VAQTFLSAAARLSIPCLSPVPKNEARKAAAKEKLKQIRDDLTAKRFKFNTKQDEPAAKKLTRGRKINKGS